jgi:transposase
LHDRLYLLSPPNFALGRTRSSPVIHAGTFRCETRPRWMSSWQTQQTTNVFRFREELLVLVRTLQGNELESWLERVKATGVRELRQFAHGLEHDKAAVIAGLTLPYSTGPVEGHINRLKLLKRQSYGRAGVAHLSRRLLAA